MHRCGPMKLAKALQFCFERCSKPNELAHTPTSAHISFNPTFSDEPVRQHHQDPPHPPPVAHCAGTDQDTPVAESTNIQTAGFFTSSVIASSISLHTLSPPKARTSPEGPVKPLRPTPTVLIVEDNPINVCINNSITCLSCQLLTIAHFVLQLMLLATYIQKRKYPFTKAENGLLGVEAVKARAENFDVILMGTIALCPNERMLMEETWIRCRFANACDVGV
jgi:hypothetical protein